MKDCCKQCKYWKDPRSMSSYESEQGECHRNPPVVNGGGSDAFHDCCWWTWPLTLSSDWCGEFQAINSTEATFDVPIKELHFPVAARKKFATFPRIETLDQLLQYSESDLMQKKKITKFCIGIIKKRLSEAGLALREDAPSPPTISPAEIEEFEQKLERMATSRKPPTFVV